MKSVIKNNIIIYLFDKKKIIVYFVFAFFCGMELNTAIATGMSMYEFALFVMNDHYYVIYFLLMSYIYFFFSDLKAENNLVNIRLKTIYRQYVSRLISNVCQTTFFVGMHILIALLIGGIALPHQNQFMASTIDGYYSDTLEILFKYSSYIGNPCIALFMTAVYMVIGLTFISMAIYLLENIIGEKGTIIATGIGVLDIMLGFKLGIGGIGEVFFLNNYFILHHVLFTSGKTYMIINLGCMLVNIIAVFFIMKKIRGNKVSSYNYIREVQQRNCRKSNVFLFAYVCLCSISVLEMNGNIAPVDVIFSCVLGYSATSFNLMEFVIYILFFMIPIFMVGIVCEDEKNIYNQQVAIRYGNRKLWKKLLNKQINIYLKNYIIFFGISIMIVSIFVYVFGDNKNSSYIPEYMQYIEVGNEIYILILVAWFVKALELFYYKNIFRFWSYIVKNRVAAYILVSFGFILNFAFPKSILVSYGCSSVYSLANGVHNRGMTVTVFGTFTVIGLKLAIIKFINNRVEEKIV